MSTVAYRQKEKFRRILFRPILSMFYCTLLTVTIAIASAAPQLGRIR
jgi:hypothetical protein